jgi:Zn-dependent protease with chaperone function
VGLGVALLATSAAATSVAGIATVSLWMTVWSFLGLLVLPSLSRRPTIAADRAAVSGGIDPGELTRVPGRLDAEQANEPRRGRLVEAVFHPVPSLERRIAALGAGRGPELPHSPGTPRARPSFSRAPRSAYSPALSPLRLR